MFFLIGSALSILIIFFLGLKNQTALVKTKKYFLAIVCLGLITSVFFGLCEGDHVSPAFTVPWWFYSFLTYIVNVLTGFFTLIVCWLIKKIKSKEAVS